MIERKLCNLLLSSIALGLLSGCFYDSRGAAQADELANVITPGTTITPDQPSANLVPNITGSPGTGATAGSVYQFTPAASDPEGQVLGFTIANKPSWAMFNTATGQLSGTPTAQDAGSYASIVISVSDGTNTIALGSFSIMVAQTAAIGTATLRWTAPTQNTDGTALSDLAGYRIYHGTSQGSLTQLAQIATTGSGTYLAQNLGSGTHYFAVSAYTEAGVESSLSNVGNKTIL